MESHASSISLDEAWATAPFYASKGKQAETTMVEAMLFSFDRHAWRWTSPDKIQHSGSKNNWSSPCAAYILAARSGSVALLPPGATPSVQTHHPVRS